MKDNNNPGIYWGIWMPTTIHTNLADKPKRRKIVEDNISDKLEYKQSVTATLNGKDIEVEFPNKDIVTDDKGEIKEINLLSIIYLNYITSSSNGLFFYKCEFDPTDKVASRLVKHPRHATIHALRKLYHNHVFHSSSVLGHSDFHFKVFIKESTSNQPFDIEKFKHEALIHYLRQVEEKFQYAVKNFEDFFSKKVKKVFGKKHVYNEYNNFLGESIFTNILCDPLTVDNEMNVDTRHLLQNINNLRDYLFFIRDHHRMRLDDFWTMTSIISSTVFFLAGLAFGFLLK